MSGAATLTMNESYLALDEERISEMIEDFGKEDFDAILEELDRDMRQAITDLTAAASVGDPGEIRDLLHLIRGCAANLGMNGIVELCADMKEVMVDNQPTANTQTVFSQAYDGSLQKLQAM